MEETLKIELQDQMSLMKDYAPKMMALRRSL